MRQDRVRPRALLVLVLALCAVSCQVAAQCQPEYNFGLAALLRVPGSSSPPRLAPHPVLHVAQDVSLALAGPWTLEMWIKPDGVWWNDASLNGVVLMTGLNAAGTAPTWQLRRSGATSLLQLEYQPEAGGSAVVVGSPAELTTSRWHHVAFSFTPGGNRCFYLDGQAACTGGSAAMSADMGDLLIGKASLADVPGFVGQIDELRVWNEARSPDQVVAGMHSSPAQAVDLYLSFDGGVVAATTVPDDSVHVNDATVVDGPIDTPASTAGTVCSNHGACQGDACQCDKDWEGPLCQTPRTPFFQTLTGQIVLLATGATLAVALMSSLIILVIRRQRRGGKAVPAAAAKKSAVATNVSEPMPTPAAGKEKAVAVPRPTTPAKSTMAGVLVGSAGRRGGGDGKGSGTSAAAAAVLGTAGSSGKSKGARDKTSNGKRSGDRRGAGSTGRRGGGDRRGSEGDSQGKRRRGISPDKHKRGASPEKRRHGSSGASGSAGRRKDSRGRRKESGSGGRRAVSGGASGGRRRSSAAQPTQATAVQRAVMARVTEVMSERGFAATCALLAVAADGDTGGRAAAVSLHVARVFAASGQTLALVRWALGLAVSTDAETDLTAQILGSVICVEAGRWLRGILNLAIVQPMRKHGTQPYLLANSDVVHESSRRLQRVCRKILDSFASESATLPPRAADVLALARTALTKSGAGDAWPVFLEDTIVLHVLSPMLSNPVLHSVVDTSATADTHTVLAVLADILAHGLSGEPFDVPPMPVMNSLLAPLSRTAVRAALADFWAQRVTDAVPGSDAAGKKKVPVSEAQAADTLRDLSEFLDQRQAEISAWLAQHSAASALTVQLLRNKLAEA